MMRINVGEFMQVKRWLLGVTALMAAGLAQAEPAAAMQEAAIEGFDSVKIAKGAAFDGYKSVYIAPPEIAFDRRWLREHRLEMTNRDQERIRESYGGMLKHALEKSFTNKTRFEVVDQPRPDTLVISPQLERFKLTAPDTSRGAFSEDFVNYVGAAELQLQLSQGEDGAAIAEIVDHRETRSFGGLSNLRHTNRVVNQRDFRSLFRSWANRTSEFVSEGQS